MTLQRKSKILEVSIASDDLYKPDNFMNAKHESDSTSIIIHNVYNPEWAARSLRNIRHAKHIIDVGESAISESVSLHVIKVLYDSNQISEHDSEKLEAFKRMVRAAIDASGVAHHPHL